ncbi:hypothetical protein DFH08DRAFT_817950 [Mycena albidolilacea]|uniref:Uncharacterized protein n=1 Tax=Mycena albidolilacea TaxID=1033008 RepID=A0AAD6ZHC7_9AGAR|nr:hypothetical protein DFH08DRAFT_817950 [Mycena albidolilacea]
MDPQAAPPQGEFHFPPGMYMVPPLQGPYMAPPGLYLSPAQVHGQLLPFTTNATTIDASNDTNSTRKTTINVSDDANSTRKSKRPRGRPRNPAKVGTSGKSKLRAAIPAKPKATTKPKATKKDTANQENTPPTIDLALTDSENDVEKSEDGKICHWTADEKTIVYEFILGSDDEAERRFEQHKVNPGHVYKKISNLFEGAHSADSVKLMYMSSLETFAWIRAFNGFIGNSGRDPNSDDPEAVLKSKIAAAHGAGMHLGALEPATITEWERNGWFDLFNSHLGTSTKVAWPVARSSASAISDLDEDFSNDNDSSDLNIDPNLRKAVLHVPKTPAAVVSEPKHTPSSTFRKQVPSSFIGLGDFTRMKEEKKAVMLELRLAIDHKRLEMDKVRGKIDMAAKVLSMPGASDEVKDHMNLYLLNYFS